MNRLLTLAVQVFGQPFQAGRLPRVQSLIALGVVAHQHLAEGRMEGLDVFGEVFAVLEVELFLAALLDGAASCSRRAAASRRMAAPNCSSTRMPAFSLGTPASTAALKPS